MFRRGSESLLLGIALLRSDEALDFLTDMVSRSPEPQAAEALSALALHRHDDALVARVRAIVASRKSRRLAEVLFAKYGE